nr:Mycolyl transferase 85A [Streptococcus thermophilus]
MKLSRPALASAAALAIAAGSLSMVHSAPADEQTAVTPLADGTEHPAPEPNPKAAADSGAEAEKPAAKEDAAEGGTELDPAPELPKPGAGADQVDDDVKRESETTPNHADQTPVLAKMTQLTEAPKRVSGGGNEDQWWFKTTKQRRNGTDWVKDAAPIVEAWNVKSASMGRDIPVAIIPARDENGTLVEDAPTLYMLNGAGGSEQNADWITSGGADIFFENKGVNVVIPMEGAFSYYVDWLAEGDYLKEKSPYFKGPQKWTTFLGREMIPAVEEYLGANEQRAVVGMSMSATSSLLLAEHYPGEFDAVGSFSGCAATSTPLPWAFAGLTVNRAASNPSYSTITPAHAWGPMGSPYNRYNDALVNADKLEGTALYISNASGLGAAEDMFGYRTGVRGQSPANAISGSATTLVEGGVIEGATNACTHDLRAKLNSLNIPAHYEFKNAGTHSWPVWEDDMRRSWNTVIGPRLLGEGFVADESLPESNSWNAERSS